MGVPLLDLKDPEPHSALDVAVPLSVLFGCNTIPIGGFIHIDARLRLGTHKEEEKAFPVTLQVAKDNFNLHISVIDEKQELFKDKKKRYCIVGGKVEEEEHEEEEENGERSEEVVEHSREEDTHVPLMEESPPQISDLINEGAAEVDVPVVIPVEEERKSIQRKRTSNEDLMIREAAGSNPVVLLDRLDDVLVAPPVGKRRRGRPKKKDSRADQTPKVKVESSETPHRFPARSNRMSKLKEMRQEYEVVETPEKGLKRKVCSPKVMKKAVAEKDQKKPHLPLPPVVAIDGQMYVTKVDQVPTVVEEEPKDLVLDEVKTDIAQELVASAEVSAEDASFIESLIEGSFVPKLQEDEEVDESLVVDVDPASAELEPGEVILEEKDKDTPEMDGDVSVKENTEEMETQVDGGEGADPAMEETSPDTIVTAQKKRKQKQAAAGKGATKAEKKDDGYFLQVSGQLYFVNGRKEKKKGQAAEVEDDSVYPFTVAGIEVPKGFRQKTFTIAQRKEISKALEPEKSRANICVLCKLVYLQKTETHMKLVHSDTTVEKNQLKCNQLYDRIKEVITRFSDQGTQLHIECPMCENDFSSLDYLEHLSSSHASYLDKEELLSNTIVCGMVKNHVRHEWTEAPHMAKLRKAVGSHTSVCPLCQKVQSKRSMHYHINIYCPVNVLRGDHFTCKECMHISVNQAEFMEHHEKYHSKKRYICQFCGSVFERKQMYYQHLRLKHKHGRAIPKEAIQCVISGCKYKTFHENRMKVHIERKHSEVSREAVPRLFRYDHLALYSDCGFTQKPHLCEHCGQSFKCKAYLTTHYLQVHPELKRYFCRRCKRGFRVHEAYKRHITCCFDLADPTSQIEFNAADAEPLKPEECPDVVVSPPVLQASDVGHMLIKEDIEASITPQEQQEFMFILQDETGSESVIEKWESIDNSQMAEGAILAQDNQPIEILPEQSYVQETMVVDPLAEGSQAVGIDSQELIKLCGNEFGEFPVGTEILVYMDNSKEGEPPKYHVVQENI
ncbi:hypothetical protein CAPTEDRAFT_200577 [Capitella teleta]|uniref:C2H2-type domain-containing protein n=1 Tax=Capitella teleta TaxID=283909 RepID=R7TFR1_CAPTE|nr:hypothetical protein CAPTEDRAFT_200577 [Capitella teleta]|eukprot:ELT89886.1 hypothetical protein CAPTEDRAFT_200577 [Capitella teleta]